MYKFCDLFDQTRFIYHKRKFRYNDPVLSILHRLDICHCADTDLAPTCPIRLFDPLCSENLRSGRKIRTFDDLKDLIDRCLAFFLDLIVDDLANGSDHFPKIVRRNIRLQLSIMAPI